MEPATIQPVRQVIKADIRVRKAQTAVFEAQGAMNDLVMFIACLLGLMLVLSLAIGLWSFVLVPVSFWLGMKTVDQTRKIERLRSELETAQSDLLRLVSDFVEHPNRAPPAEERGLH